MADLNAPDKAHHADEKASTSVNEETDMYRDLSPTPEKCNQSDNEEELPRLWMDCESDGGGLETDDSDTGNGTGAVIVDSSQNVNIVEKTDGRTIEVNMENEKIEVELSADFNDEKSCDSPKENKKRPKPKSRASLIFDQEKPYNCSKCKLISPTYSSHLLHNCKPTLQQEFTVTYHKSGNVFSCSCEHIFHKLKSFHEHLVSHIIDEPFRCSLCMCTFTSRSKVIKHLSSKHPRNKMRFYVNGLKYTSGFLEKAKQFGSYTHKFEGTKKKSENINQTIELDKEFTCNQKKETVTVKSESKSSLKIPPTKNETSASSSSEVIIIDDCDSPPPVKLPANEPLNPSLSCSVVSANTNYPFPVELFKNISNEDMFQFVFSTTSVTYSCTKCKKQWDSRSDFCHHIWSHQHENGKKCPECHVKTNETEATCMETVRLFRKLAFSNFTKTKKRAEDNGALKDIRLEQMEFLNESGSVNAYKCTVCDLCLPQIRDLKWHVWKHLHSSIICPACSVIRRDATRYIICPLVEKLVNKIVARGEELIKIVVNSGNGDEVYMHNFPSGKKFGSITKLNQSVYVCYICSKQWTDRARFWLHAWSHLHEDRKPCTICKTVDYFPGMTCSSVDNEMDFESKPIKSFNNSSNDNILEENMIDISCETTTRTPSDNDIIIIDDAPESSILDEGPIDSLSSSFIDEDEAEIVIDKPGTTCSDISFTNSDSNNTTPPTKTAPAQILVLNVVNPLVPHKEGVPIFTKELLDAQTNFPQGLRRSFLSSKETTTALSAFILCKHKQYICLICSMQFGKTDLIHLLEHLITKHLKIPLVQCGYCEFNASKEYLVSSHSRQKHPDKSCQIKNYKINITDSVSKYITLLKFDRPGAIKLYGIKVSGDTVKQLDVSQQNVSVSQQDVSQQDVSQQNVAEKVCAEPIKQITCTSGSEETTGNRSNALIEKQINTMKIEHTPSKKVKLEKSFVTPPPNMEVKYEVTSTEIDNAMDIDNQTDSGPQILSTFSLAISKPPDDMDKVASDNTIKDSNVTADNCYFTSEFYACGLCKYTTLIMEDFRKHLFTQHAKEKAFPCIHCGFIGIRVDQLIKHFVYHTNLPSIPVFQCIELDCEYQSNGLEAFMTHLESHNLMQQECHECASSMNTLEELKMHYKMNLLCIINCSHCTAVATEKDTLLDHHMNWHDGLPPTFRTGKQLVCRDRQLFNYEGNSSKFLAGHDKLYFKKAKLTPLPSKDAVFTSKTNDQILELNCKLCSYYATTSTLLATHGKVHSMEQEDRPFICPFCTASFNEQKSLTSHMSKHAETQMLVFYFSCKFDGYCTNVYQKIMQHIHDGQHTLSPNPKDMFSYEEVAIRSEVVRCPQCAFKSSCRGYLTGHILKAHNAESDHKKPDEVTNDEIVSVPTKLYSRNEEECSYSTYNDNDFKQHVKTHNFTEVRKTTDDMPFSDINTYKKDFHIYIPTDGPETQDNFNLFAIRVKQLYVKDKEKDHYRCKVCNLARGDQTQLLKHMLLHFKIMYRCYMCPYTNTIMWRMTKHAKAKHNCKFYNIIYSDKIEEVAATLLKGEQENSSAVSNKPAVKTRKQPSRSSTPEIDTLTEITSTKLTSTGSKSQDSTSGKDGSSGSMISSKKQVTETPSCKAEENSDKSSSSLQSITSATVDNSYSQLINISDSSDEEPTEVKKSTEPLCSIQSTSSTKEKHMCLLGSDYMDSSLSVLYSTFNNRYQCKICKLTFPSKTRYWIHHHLSLNHLKLNLYQCWYCDFRAIEKFKIQQHISKKHVNDVAKVRDIDVNIVHAVYNYVKTSKLDIQVPEPTDVEFNEGLIPEKIISCPSQTESSSSGVVKRFRCEHCKESFPYEIKAKMHCNSAHPEKDPKVSVIFQKVTVNSDESSSSASKRKSSEQYLPRKKSKQFVESNYKCPQCKFCTDLDLDAMIEHFKSHNYEKIIECGICSLRSFDDKSYKKHHRVAHATHQEKFNRLPIVKFFKVITPSVSSSCISDKRFNYTCKQCGLKSNHVKRMKSHIHDHIENLNSFITCSVCSKCFVESSSRRTHFLQTHLSANNMKNLDYLVQFLAKNLLEQDKYMKSEKTKNFMCSICKTSPYLYTCIHDLNKHYASFHKRRNNLNTFWTDMVTGGTYNMHGLLVNGDINLEQHKTFICRYCDFRSDTRAELSAHEVIHPSKGLKRTIQLRYPDSEYDNTAASGSNTNIGSEIVYLCPLCPEVAKKIADFREHLVQHDGVRKKTVFPGRMLLRCRCCKYSTPLQSSFNSHVLTHLMHKQFSCQHCVFEANQLTPVKLHAKSSHPDKSLESAVVNLRSPTSVRLVSFDVSVKLNNFFEMTPNEFENLLNKAGVQDVDLSTVPLEIAEKLLLAYT